MAGRKGTFAKSGKPVPARPLPTPRGVESKKTVTTEPPRIGSGREAPELEPLGYVRSLIRDVPDFPQAGILFRDITPLLADPKAFHIVLDAIAHRFLSERIDAVVGVERS